jgi:hypothetical protein
MMNEKAFPNPHRTDELGMTLRDYFAAKALANAYTQHDGNPDKVAEWAYAVADAMLKARQE